MNIVKFDLKPDPNLTFYIYIYIYILLNSKNKNALSNMYIIILFFVEK